MVSGITPCAQECKWTDYFGEPPNHCLTGPFALIMRYWWGFRAVLPNTHYQRSQGAMTELLYAWRGAQSTTQTLQ
jgi:hypothetical protein